MEVNKVNIRLVTLSHVYNSFQDFTSITSILQFTFIWNMNKKYYVLTMHHLSDIGDLRKMLRVQTTCR